MSEPLLRHNVIFLSKKQSCEAAIKCLGGTTVSNLFCTYTYTSDTYKYEQTLAHAHAPAHTRTSRTNMIPCRRIWTVIQFFQFLYALNRNAGFQTLF